ncbi:MAG: hypothetical protein KTR32_42020 [Granulosicoccus sp.]|nr:hypothetical protein [Granulosicoccus sp.]
MNTLSVFFCSLTLVATVAVTWLAFPYAAMSEDELSAATTPVDAELLGEVNLADFGEVSVFDMVLHYIDNPPLESDEELPKVRFQGC